MVISDNAGEDGRAAATSKTLVLDNPSGGTTRPSVPDELDVPSAVAPRTGYSVAKSPFARKAGSKGGFDSRS